MATSTAVKRDVMAERWNRSISPEKKAAYNTRRDRLRGSFENFEIEILSYREPFIFELFEKVLRELIADKK